MFSKLLENVTIEKPSESKGTLGRFLSRSPMPRVTLNLPCQSMADSQSNITPASESKFASEERKEVERLINF
jgi:hypothetical protein